MIALDITKEEVESRTLTPEHLQAAVNAIREEGFIVLNDIVETAHLEMLKERMLADVDAIVSRPDAPFNFNSGNVQQDPPPFPPYLFRDVLLNDIVIAITKAVLGPGLKLTLYSGNTNLPGSTEQPVHADTGQLWPELETAPPAHALVVNIPVIAMDVQNGSTEVWPRTHKDTTISVQFPTIKVPEAIVEKWRASSPPLQPTVRQGSVLIRDMRLWHRGMPNHTKTPRPMIAIVHEIGWKETDCCFEFPKGTEDFFKQTDLSINRVFVDGTIDYLHHNSAYDYKK